MFHVASAASIIPARSPTRGSGLGAAVDIPFGEAASTLDDEIAGAHAAAEISPSANDSVNSGTTECCRRWRTHNFGDMADSSEGDWDMETSDGRMITARAIRW